MDLSIHAICVMISMAWACLCLLLPVYLLFKFLASSARRLVSGGGMRMDGKVVLVTGASSGIGEQMVYEYARRGARVVMIARRKKMLQQVAKRARDLGSPEALAVQGDVSRVEDCEQLVADAVARFGRLDHLVNNAGIASVCRVEEAKDIANFRAVMDTNFWGSVYATYFAIPHLKKTKGTIVVISSTAAFLNAPRISFYCASKAAMVSFFEALRVELHPSVTVTVAVLGFVESEMTAGKNLSGEGEMEVNGTLRDVIRRSFPVMETEACAKAVVRGACRGERTVTVPAWYHGVMLLKRLCPELLELYFRLSCFTKYPNPPRPPHFD